MDETHSGPTSPIRRHAMSPIDTSPAHSPSPYRTRLRRRTSSFSSYHDPSPTTPKSRHRFSNASQLSLDIGSPVDEDGATRSGRGLGNLADELDQLDDEDEDYEEGPDVDAPDCEGDAGQEGAIGEEQSRDSGIDVTYPDPTQNGAAAKQVRNFSKPFGGSKEDRPPGEADEHGNLDGEDRLSSDLEDLMNTIARMTSYTSTTEDPLIPRTIGQLQDLGNQTNLEAAAHRYTTSTNSLTSHLNSQAKALQTLAQSLYPMFAGFAAPLDPEIAEEVVPLLDALKENIPQPDLVPVQKLQKLDRETTDIISTLSQLTDTLQMGKQITNSAARHLRSTQTMVVELRREHDKADLARHELAKTDWHQRLKDRWCGEQCKDIISGFEDHCNTLRSSLEEVN